MSQCLSSSQTCDGKTENDHTKVGHPSTGPRRFGGYGGSARSSTSSGASSSCSIWRQSHNRRRTGQGFLRQLRKADCRW
jgi:hypothetical protein